MMSIAELLELHKPGAAFSAQAWQKDSHGQDGEFASFASPSRGGQRKGQETKEKPRSTGTSVAVIGSGGKTTLLWLLAHHFRHERVLVSTTVKMWPPEPGQYDSFPDTETFAKVVASQRGITFAGAPLPKLGKIGALPLEILEARLSHFDKTFIEADGSRGLPYKGWAEHEPVVPEWVDMTVAVLPVPRPDWRVSGDNIHRLPTFCAISGAKAGELLRPEHLAAVIAHPEGLLAKARGRIALFFNQAENEADRAMARHIAGLLPKACRDRIWKIGVGSARKNAGIAI